MLSAAAVAEFKIGSAERGRAIFEDVLRNYPKRTDLWSVYLDQAWQLCPLKQMVAQFFRCQST